MHSAYYFCRGAGVSSPSRICSQMNIVSSTSSHLYFLRAFCTITLKEINILESTTYCVKYCVKYIYSWKDLQNNIIVSCSP